MNLFEEQAKRDAAMSKASREMYERIQKRARLNKLFGVSDPAFECQCENSGKCDSCVAARSDEHYDRKRDGEMK